MIVRNCNKVFPYEYQRVLKQLEETTSQDQPIVNGNSQTDSSRVKDIEEAVADTEVEQKKLDKIR